MTEAVAVWRIGVEVPTFIGNISTTYERPMQSMTTSTAMAAALHGFEATALFATFAVLACALDWMVRKLRAGGFGHALCELIEAGSLALLSMDLLVVLHYAGAFAWSIR
jgi:hypothetical protein